MSYTNADGLFVLTDGDQGAVKDNGGALAATKVLVIEIPDATKLGTAQTAPTANDAFIPAGSYITSASFVVTTAFTSGGAGTLGLGLFTLANGTINATGIDAAIAKADLAANKAVACNGDLVGGVATVGAADAYVGALHTSTAFTAGAGKLVIEYIEV